MGVPSFNKQIYGEKPAKEKEQKKDQAKAERMMSQKPQAEKCPGREETMESFREVKFNISIGFGNWAVITGIFRKFTLIWIHWSGRRVFPPLRYLVSLLGKLAQQELPRRDIALMNR